MTTVASRFSCLPKTRSPLARLTATRNDPMRKVIRSEGRKKTTAYSEPARKTQGSSCIPIAIMLPVAVPPWTSSAEVVEAMTTAKVTSAMMAGSRRA